ncbi:lysine transporter LysE [Vibrio sp. MACH09]|uniref:LysE family translocator n=1 Tax=unclassified Vibrio TaxID=2614977 RepID=UPI0014935AEC|nr:MULTISPECIES: LysE family translocator [unclassified Vibrio]NOI68776.1 LysE family translocator [Vibrio sp. 99-8-1]GLO59854.1 lysine transporter LysE [Vibrio sp. MACH09]
MSFTVWLSLFTICLLGAMSPGPSLAIVAKHSLAGSRLNGIATSWAHASGIAIYAFITIVGLATLLHQSPMLFQLLSYVGATYLAYLGFNAIRSKGGIAAKLESGEAVSVWQSAKEGFLISLTSPKIMLFFIALFGQFVSESSEASSRAVVVMTPFLVDGIWYTLITFMLSSSLLLEKLRSKAKLIDQLSGIVLIALAIRVIWTA